MRIGLFLKNLDEEYQISVYRGIKAEAQALGMDLICIQGERPHYKQGIQTDDFPSRELIGADGILLLSSVLTDMMHADLKTIFAHIPLVSIGVRLPGYPSISIKCRRSMELLLDHLICFHGYRKLLYIGGPVKHLDNIVRERIFRSYIHTLRPQFPELEGTVIHGDFHKASGTTIVRDYMAAHYENPPDAIVAANDTMAIGAQEMLHTQTAQQWHDCPVTGFDDIDLARLEIPALTTIHQPLDALGRLAVRTLRASILGQKVPAVIHVASELRIRSSCGCKDSAKDAEKDQLLLTRGISGPEYQLILSEYHLRNVSNLGQNLTAVNTNEEMVAHVQSFLTELAVQTFYLILYAQPLGCIGTQGNVIYQRVSNHDTFYVQNPHPIVVKQFFADMGAHQGSGPRSWCITHLRSGSEYLGFIVYEAPDTVHPQLCSGAIFIANTVKRLRNLDDEKERSRQLEQEIAFRTRDLVEINKKLHAEAERRIEVEAEVLRISELERLRFSMDLHDDICQRLAGISMFCKSLVGGVNPELLLPELSEMINETLLRTRRYAHDSFPMELDTFGLNEALRSLCHSISKETDCRCSYTWSAPDPSPLSPAQDINVYRIIQEALQNAVKHSRASRIEVLIQAEKGMLIVLVKDNGIGNSQLNKENPVLNSNKRRAGLGLRSMRYRAHQLGAEYVFESSESEGTRVEVRIPGINIS
jgi:signal transduction histidine kinase/DNA-binding LacI/PurR family transcriptional regulator